MKNNLKRIAIILPVIALLLAFLAVPAAAAGTDGGVIDPVTYSDFIYYEGGTANPRFVSVTLGSPFSLVNGETFSLRYLVEVDVSSMSGHSFDTLSDHVFAISLSLTNGSAVKHIVSRVSNLATRLTYYVFDTDGSPAQFSRTHDEIDSFMILCTEDVIPSLSNVNYTVYYVDTPSPTEPIGNVWTGIMTWITSALTTVMGAFYVDGSLTLLGTLACIGVSVGIGFLLIGLIQRFLKLRG